MDRRHRIRPLASRSLVWRDDDNGWWKWSCGRRPCTAGGADRSRPAAQERLDDHLAGHERFGFRPGG